MMKERRRGHPSFSFGHHMNAADEDGLGLDSSVQGYGAGCRLWSGEKDGQVGAKGGHFVGPLVNAVRGSLYSRRICRRNNV